MYLFIGKVMIVKRSYIMTQVIKNQSAPAFYADKFIFNESSQLAFHLSFLHSPCIAGITDICTGNKNSTKTIKKWKRKTERC